MNDPIIYTENLSKIYRLYSKPHYRFLDMFGLLGKKQGAYTEHKALDGINLEIQRGEKVAFIGRNGAGKSTFLKLVTNVTKPTSGRLVVKGKAHALLQIGTGFHPDFTGRENIYAYLAQLGVTGRQAKIKCAEIIDFAELEEYIDQPVKTYSTGMGVRLMFSTSTAISPNLLVLDEVLGVGDAYFAQKSYERIQELCDREGTTLLLVSHDVYSASRICDRMIWIDRGRILIDGDPATVVKAYEDSIRVQEENRLRLRKQARLKDLEQGKELSNQSKHLIIEIYSDKNSLQPSSVYFREITLFRQDFFSETLPLIDSNAGNEQNSHIKYEGSNWGEPTNWKGYVCRPLLNYGSPFHKVAGVFVIPSRFIDSLRKDFQVRLIYYSELPCKLRVRFFLDDERLDIGELPAIADKWANHAFSLDLQKKNNQQPKFLELNDTGIQGTGTILVKNLAMFDAEGNETYYVEHGAPIVFSAEFKIVDPSLCEYSQVIVTFHKNGVQDVCRVVTKELHFDAARSSCGEIKLFMPKMMLANGSYTVSIMITEEGYFDQHQYQFYSLNPGVYCCLARILEINVTGGGIIGNGTGVVGEGVWSVSEKNK